jgi:signal transduction histidine kinase
LNQIVLNLVGNAVKFTEQGRVQIQLSQGLDGVRRVLQVSVHDTGIGIPLEEQPKLFEAYSRVDSSHPRHPEGTGLGLHLSRMLAEALGGRILLLSQVGGGSTFTLVLPEVSPP